MNPQLFNHLKHFALSLLCTINHVLIQQRQQLDYRRVAEREQNIFGLLVNRFKHFFFRSLNGLDPSPCCQPFSHPNWNETTIIGMMERNGQARVRKGCADPGNSPSTKGRKQQNKCTLQLSRYLRKMILQIHKVAYVHFTFSQHAVQYTTSIPL